MIRENLLPKVWGPSTWISLHSMTFGYPNDPSAETKINCLAFFTSLKDMLPCSYCGESYAQYIIEPDTLLTIDTVKDMDTLSRWLYNVHEKVNKKLSVNYGVTYEEVKEKYMLYIAKCTTETKSHKFCSIPIKAKAISYSIIDTKDCPIIPYDMAVKFKKYAKQRKVKEFDELDKYNKLSKDHKSEEWKQRNVYCNEIIKYMRKNAIPSIEQDGKWHGMPTIEELKMISKMSSILNTTELDEIIKKYIDKNKTTKKYIIKKNTKT